MPADALREQGHAVIDWITTYLHEAAHDAPVLSSVQPGEIYAALPEHPPTTGEPFEAWMADVERVVMPGITHWQSPNFYAFFPANVSGPAILGDLLSSGLGVQGMLWATSPACTEVETRMLDWLVEMLDLPRAFLSTGRGGGVLQDTASSVSLCALVAARERLTGGRTNEEGYVGGMTIYTSVEAHSSIEKSAMIAGFGRAAVRKIPVDDAQAMNVDALRSAIEADVASGLRPCLVVATVGTTSTNGMDPLAPIGAIAKQHGAWFHVDAAYAGTAALCPEFRWMHDGMETADSYCFNPHKWMLTNFDCSCFWVRDRDALTSSLSIDPEYLRNHASDSGDVFDYRDWHVPLGRRFRALKLWFVIRHYGVEGLQQHVRHGIALARTLAERITADPNLTLLRDPPLTLLCFSHVNGNEATEALLHRLNASGQMYLTHTKVGERYVIRFCIGATRTEAKHVDAAWETIRDEAAALR
ncbi:MAG: aminotransferase class V-fold PLP-dependent enzyme [Planctomycetota bacterium]|jgi:aromatic-L-amino-acid decarboxylase